MSLIAVIRIRGVVHTSPDIRKTMDLLNLTRVNHCVLIQDTPQNKGMIKKVKDYATWGTISKETLKALMEKRGRMTGKKRINADLLKDNVLEKIYNGETKIKDIEGLKPVFRLHPPKKGFERKGIKKTFKQGGVLGPRESIDSLLVKMI